MSGLGLDGVNVEEVDLVLEEPDFDALSFDEDLFEPDLPEDDSGLD